MPDQNNTDRFVVISGCSGGGKSTLLAELGRRGYAVVEEPGRRIVREQLKARGSALPWVDAAAFARRAVAMSLADRAAVAGRGDWVFFDRGLIDAAAALQHLTGEAALLPLRQSHRYHRRVFLAPPWPEIYVTDTERRHDFDTALPEYQRLLQTYPSLGYEICILPKTGVRERANFVLSELEGETTCHVRESGHPASVPEHAPGPRLRGGDDVRFREGSAECCSGSTAAPPGISSPS